MGILLVNDNVASMARTQLLKVETGEASCRRNCQITIINVQGHEFSTKIAHGRWEEDEEMKQREDE